MSKWKEYIEPGNFSAKKGYLRDRNEALDLLEGAQSREWGSGYADKSLRCDWYKRRDALLDRLREPEHTNEVWQRIKDKGECPNCGRPEPTVREQVTAIEGNVHSVRDTIRLLADEIDKLKSPL